MDDYNKQIVEPGDRFSEVARKVCLASHNNSTAVTMYSGTGFRSMDGFNWNSGVLKAMLSGQIYQVPQSDGAGGKLQFYALNNTAEAFYSAGWEPITMNADDVACRGGFPVIMASSNIDVQKITDRNWHLCEAVLRGFGDALKASNLVLMTGETAIMPHCITAFCDINSDEQLIMTWNATCLGLASTTKAPNGSTITPGMKIIGFRDKGYRCNGGTKFTNIILDIWGPDIDKIIAHADAQAFIQKLVEPSRSYASTIARLNGWQLDGSLNVPLAKLHGVAHITGGGIWSKLVEILPEGVGANLHSMPGPADVLLEAQWLASQTSKPMTDYQCHGTFHGGCGLMAICEGNDVPIVLREARKDGHDPFVIGETTESAKNEVLIKSRFLHESHLSSLDPH